MFDIFNSYDTEKLKLKMLELERRIQTLESEHNVTFEDPMPKRTEKINALTKEEFDSLTNLMTKTQKELKQIKENEVPQKTLDCFYELATLIKEDQYEYLLLKQAIRDRQMGSVNEVMGKLFGGKL